MKVVRGVFFLLSFVYCSRILFGIPSSIYYISEMAFSVICFFIFLSYFIISNKVYKHEVLLLSILLIPFYSAIVAYFNFGQDFFYGILARRDVLIVFIPLALSRMLLNSTLTYGLEFVRTIILFCKLYLCLVVFVSSVLDPIYFVTLYGIDDPFVSFFIDYSTSLSAYRYKPSFFPIVLLFFYMIFVGYKGRSISSVIWIFVCLYWFLFLYGGRSLILSIALALIIHIMLPIYKISILKFTNRMFSLSIILLGAISIILLFPDIFGDRIEGGLNAISMLNNHSNVNDVSILSRKQQLAVISSYYNINTLMFGIGSLSAQWNGGFEAIFGRFHPSDLGFFGAVFLNGIFGAVIISIPIYLFIKQLRSINTEYGMAIFIFFIIISIPTGFVLFHSVSLVYLVLIIRISHFWENERANEYIS